METPPFQEKPPFQLTPLFLSNFFMTPPSTGNPPLILGRGEETMAKYKLLNKNLNFIPTPKVYNKNELDADLNDFFRRIKLKAYFKDTPNNKNHDESRLFKQNKSKKWTPPNNHHTINTSIEAVKKDIKQSKTVTPRKIRPNLSKDKKIALKDISKRDDIIILLRIRVVQWL